jgi:hypothetical protein
VALVGEITIEVLATLAVGRGEVPPPKEHAAHVASTAAVKTAGRKTARHRPGRRNAAGNARFDVISVTAVMLCRTVATRRITTRPAVTLAGRSPLPGIGLILTVRLHC